MPYGDSEDRRKEYIITTLGKEIVKKELIRLDQLVSVANEIVGGAIWEKNVIAFLEGCWLCKQIG